MSNFIHSEPSYQSQGVSARFVKADQYSRLTLAHANCSVGFKPYMIKKIIEKCIPDQMTGFGSLRGYATWGLDGGILKKINQAIDLKKKELAVKIIQRWYNDMMFKPGGSGFVMARNSFDSNIECMKRYKN